MKTLDKILREKFPFATKIENSSDAALYFNTAFGTRDDPHFLMTTEDGYLVNFGRTALIKAIQQLEDSGLQNVVYRDEQGNFPGLDEEKLKVIDRAYDLVHSMDLDKNEYTRIFKGLNANYLTARFKDFNLMKGPRDIIPDYNDLMVFIKLSDGCLNRCLHCPEAGGIRLYSKSDIEENMKFMRSIQMKYHGPETRKLMYEGFLNTSDLLWFEKLKSDTNPFEITEMMKENFPELIRIGSFFELHNVLEVCKTGNPDKPYDSSYLKELAERGLTRAYVGVETAHYLGSDLLGKSESYETKRQGLELLKEAKIGVKAILLMGALGTGFYDDHGRFHSSREALDETALLMHETKPYRIMYSRFLPLENLPLMDYYASGRIIPYEDNSKIDEEMDYMSNRLLEKRHIGPNKWQGKEPEPVIEPDYADFVEGRKRLVS